MQSLRRQLTDAGAELEAAREDAARDELTGVANRREFERILEQDPGAFKFSEEN